MAWRSGGDCHNSLVQTLAKNRLLRSDVVLRAFQSVDRKWFVPKSVASEAYNDCPLPIGYSVTISAPHMHAIMAEILGPHVVGKHKRVLDVGSGSGFLTCILAAMVDASSVVVGVEHVPQLVESSSLVAGTHFKEWVSPQADGAHPRLTFLQGDGLNLVASALPFPLYDVIHVGAAPPEVPQCLVDVLAPSGVMVIPVGPQSDVQDLVVVSKDANGKVSKRLESKVQFVPLTSLDCQLRRD